MIGTNSVLGGYGTTIFTTMSKLAVDHGAVNLGQGFPDGNGPDDVRALAQAALDDRPNQYPPMMGLPELRQAVAAHASRFYGLDYDPMTETLVTSGATEALAACMMGLLNPGDEVVLLEPLYDSYRPVLELIGAVPRLVPLTPPRWELPRADFAAAFGPRTKMVLLNSPMNPCGKVFNLDELSYIADCALRHDAVMLCDEVYEHLTFGDTRHIPIATLPGMRERTLRIGSAGKTFSLTGWKVGYVSGAAPLVAAAAKAHQFLTFTTPPNLQRAVAYGLQKDDAYFMGLATDMDRKRDRLMTGLRAIGFDVAAPQGTYFLMADFRPFGFAGDDIDFCETITREARVAAIPASAFYASRETAARVGADRFARFCFCKDDATLDEALNRLGDYFAAKTARAAG